MSLPAAASGAEPGTAADATVVSRSQAGHAELPTVTVTAAPEATGTAEQGYREDRVSQVGPWEGRNLQDTPYLFVTADDGIQFAAAGCFVQIDGILFQ